MEASALPAPAAVARSRISIGAPLLRLRSDEQLVAMFRAGDDEAFRVIHDRYRQRLFAYTRQMLPGSRQDAEDALQDVFVRAYSGLRANHREIALRAWLYRVAHNRCVDELRRSVPPRPELIEMVRAPIQDPIAEAERRESLRRLIADVRELPEQQRSALLMRELVGMTYLELADALGVSIPAIKSLLVRARVGLTNAAEARDTACSEIREELTVAHDRRMRPNSTARRHMRECAGCRHFRREIRGVSGQLAALMPTVGPLGVLAKLLGLGGGASGGAVAGGGAAAAGGVAGTGGAFAATGAFGICAGHVATVLAAAVVTAGGAAEIQHTITGPTARSPHHPGALPYKALPGAAASAAPASGASQPAGYVVSHPSPLAAVVAMPTRPASTISARRNRPAPVPPDLGTLDAGSSGDLSGPSPPSTDSGAGSSAQTQGDGSVSQPASSGQDGQTGTATQSGALTEATNGAPDQGASGAPQASSGLSASSDGSATQDPAASSASPTPSAGSASAANAANTGGGSAVSGPTSWGP